ncbi:hypothetical protein SHJG_0222 [Streptomyces hygroscopicus subsp. jinggangensis 5008]|nr:hypothetical protein SHJG_0222 [Streptomyces hygroscopicus subsp. jinggangensis 5008]
MSAAPGPMTEQAVEVTASRWLTDFYSKVDELDADHVAERFHPDAVMQFATDAPHEGREAIRTGLSSFFTILSSMKHTFHRVWQAGDTVLLEATVTYHMRDGRTLPIPVVTIIERRDGPISSLRVFIDRAPMFA